MHTQHCKECDFFTFCTFDQNTGIEQLFSHSVHKIQLKKGEILKLKQPRYLYMITEGAVKMILENQHSMDRVYNLCLEGESFGYETFSKRDCSINVIAVSNTKLCRIALDKFDLARHEALQKLLMLMGQKILQRTYLAYSNAEAKMIGFLLELSGRYKNSTFILPLTREGIGQHLGLASETVSRILSKLSKNKQIRLANKQVTILAQAQLQNLLQSMT